MKAGNSMEMAIAGVAFVIFVATVFLYLNKDNSEAKAYAENNKLILEQFKIVNKKLEEINFQIEAAHLQADSAKSTAQAADLLANKVAMDLAKHPLRAVAAQNGPIKMEPVKFEPIRIVIYDKRDLKKTTETVKPPNSKTVVK